MSSHCCLPDRNTTTWISQDQPCFDVEYLLDPGIHTKVWNSRQPLKRYMRLSRFSLGYGEQVDFNPFRSLRWERQMLNKTWNQITRFQESAHRRSFGNGSITQFQSQFSVFWTFGQFSELNSNFLKLFKISFLDNYPNLSQFGNNCLKESICT